MMPRQLKVHACLIVIVAVIFYLFFQISKHEPALSQVNAFSDDPYDAVGSFAVQLALFTALLSLIRAFRPYRQKQELDNQKLLFVRGAYLTCLSIVMTLITDIVAMLRHPAVWGGQSAGYILVALIGGIALLTVLVSLPLHRWMRTMHLSSERHVWIRAISVSLGSILILALYPENWRQSVSGELLTVVAGAICLFVPIWAIGIAISPFPGPFFEDFIDDLASVYRWLKAHIGPFVICFLLLEKVCRGPLIYLILSWLNPRKHTWNATILLGIAMGMGLMLGEVFGEGGGPYQLGRFALVAAVFISLECFAVCLGYALLAQPLGLFRQNSEG